MGRVLITIFISLTMIFASPNTECGKQLPTSYWNYVERIENDHEVHSTRCQGNSKLLKALYYGKPTSSSVDQWCDLDIYIKTNGVLKTEKCLNLFIKSVESLSSGRKGSRFGRLMRVINKKNKSAVEKYIHSKTKSS